MPSSRSLISFSTSALIGRASLCTCGKTGRICTSQTRQPGWRGVGRESRLHLGAHLGQDNQRSLKHVRVLGAQKHDNGLQATAEEAAQPSRNAPCKADPPHLGQLAVPFENEPAVVLKRDDAVFAFAGGLLKTCKATTGVLNSDRSICTTTAANGADAPGDVWHSRSKTALLPCQWEIRDMVASRNRPYRWASL